MIKQSHKKIAIVGNAGSGKTTAALLLADRLNLPLYHLDQYYWLPGWQRMNFEEFCTIHNGLCEKDEWIIEGSYMRASYPRMFHADVIIFLDVPRYVCIWRVLKRSIMNHGKILPGSPAGCRQRILSFEFITFLKWVWNYNKRTRIALLQMLEEFKEEKEIYILKGSSREIEQLLSQYVGG